MNNSAEHTWMNQQTPGFAPTPGEIRSRAEQSKQRTRRRRSLLTATAVGALLSAIGALLFIDSPVVIWFRAIQVVTWVLFLTIGPQLYLERTRLQTLGLASTPVPCLEHYRRELESQRNSLRPAPWTMTIVAVFALGIVTFGQKNRPVVVSLAVLMLLIAIVGYVRMRRTAPKIQKELEDLRTFNA
jgi:lysozyme family protein